MNNMINRAPNHLERIEQRTFWVACSSDKKKNCLGRNDCLTEQVNISFPPHCYSWFSPTWLLLWRRLLSAMLVPKTTHSIKRSQWLSQLFCVVLWCGSRSDRDKLIGFYRIPSVVSNKENIRWKDELFEDFDRERFTPCISLWHQKTKNNSF